MFKKLYNTHKRTGRDFLWRALQMVGKQGVPCLIFFIAAKFLSPESFGDFSYLMAVVGLLIIICDFGFSTAVSRYVAEYNFRQSEKLNNILFSISIVSIGISTFISAVIVLLGGRVFKDNFRYILCLLPYLFLMPLTSIADGMYRGLKQFKKLALISIIVGGFSLAASFFLISRYLLIGAILSQIILYFLMAVALFAFQRNLKIRFDKGIFAEVARYAIVLGIAGVAFFLYTRVDILILKQFGYVVEIGYYEIVNRIFQMLIIPFAILGQVVAPNTVKYATANDFAEIRSKLKKYAAFCLGIGLVLGVCLHFGIPPALQTVLPQHHTAQFLMIMNILLVLLPFKVFGTCLNQGFIVPAGYAKITAVATGAGGLLNVVLDYIFIDCFGYIGVFWATLLIHSLSIVAVTACFLYAIRRKDPQRRIRDSQNIPGGIGTLDRDDF
ncbi:MAG: oligosaccharide flippase family protein [Sedimentisphaerales bacterium]|nr:oligosaccharide flippase family protein [Sedimentisphaerales bacterium]